MDRGNKEQSRDDLYRPGRVHAKGKQGGRQGGEYPQETRSAVHDRYFPALHRGLEQRAQVRFGLGTLAARYLGAMSFAESSFFPIQVEVMLAPMVISRIAAVVTRVSAAIRE